MQLKASILWMLNLHHPNLISHQKQVLQHLSVFYSGGCGWCVSCITNVWPTYGKH